MLCTWRPPWRRFSLHICLRFVCRMCLFVFSWALTSTVKYPLSCPTFTYLKLSMYKWTLVYPFKSFFRIIQGAHSWTVYSHCSVVLLFHCGFIYFLLISHTINASWQSLCCTAVVLTFYISRSFLKTRVLQVQNTPGLYPQTCFWQGVENSVDGKQLGVSGPLC